MWNNGTLYPIKGMFVDESVCSVVPKGSTWARNPIPRIHDNNIGMAFIGGCWSNHHLVRFASKKVPQTSGVQTGRIAQIFQLRVQKLIRVDTVGTRPTCRLNITHPMTIAMKVGAVGTGPLVWSVIRWWFRAISSQESMLYPGGGTLRRLPRSGKIVLISIFWQGTND